MNRAWGIVLIISVASASSQAVAAPPVTRPPSAKRLLIACMTKEMSSSRTISYNEATKVCKVQLKTQSATLASGTVKPMS
jgi:hypothetical protein